MQSGTYIGAHLSPNNKRDEGRSSVKMDHGVEARVSECQRPVRVSKVTNSQRNTIVVGEEWYQRKTKSEAKEEEKDFFCPRLVLVAV